MTNCCDEGQLRAYLDGELPALERAAVGAHIGSCAACRHTLETQRALAAQMRALLPAPAAIPDPHMALGRLRSAAQAPAGPASAEMKSTGRTSMQYQISFWARRRSWLAGVAAIVAILSLLALPPVRAAADQLLSVFRVQKVVFMPIDPDRVEQLKALNLNGNTLFVGKPQMNDRTPPRTVASADEAAQAAGYAIAQPGQLPSAPQSTTYTVVGPNKAQFQVNVAGARQMLDLLGIDDVTIPDALGAQPIQVESKPFVAVHYHGANYDLTLNQGQSPNVTLPEGVDLAQLGKAALRVLGTPPEQAEIASRQINWNNTLIFPFPADTDNIRQVSVNGEPALLVGGGARRSLHWQLYWQSGDRLYMLEGQGNLGGEDLVAALITTAESVR
jgi:Putative zinc-finger